jgi:hypothetical protein
MWHTAGTQLNGDGVSSATFALATTPASPRSGNVDRVPVEHSLVPVELPTQDVRTVTMTNPLLRMALTSLMMFGVGSSASRQHLLYRDTIIRDVTLISPERGTPLLHADVVLRDGKIVEIGTNLVPGQDGRRIDGSGRFLIPGLIDSHVHVGRSAALNDDAIDTHPKLWAAYRKQVPRAYLAFGFTSVVDLDLKPSDKEWFESTPLHPRLYSCGEGIKVAGGYMAFTPPAPSSPRFSNLVYVNN